MSNFEIFLDELVLFLAVFGLFQSLSQFIDEGQAAKIHIFQNDTFMFLQEIFNKKIFIEPSEDQGEQIILYFIRGDGGIISSFDEFFGWQFQSKYALDFGDEFDMFLLGLQDVLSDNLFKLYLCEDGAGGDNLFVDVEVVVFVLVVLEVNSLDVMAVELFLYFGGGYEDEVAEVLGPLVEGYKNLSFAEGKQSFLFVQFYF